MKGIDLHAHTTASDGDKSPTELVWWAKCLGLSAIAVTDHDTTDGVEEALRAGEKYGVRVIPGIELSAEVPSPAQCHILGYFVDPNCEAMQQRLKWVRDARDTRNERMVAKMQAHGWNVTLTEIEQMAGGEVVARPHFAKVLLQKGYVASMQEAFDRYLGRGAQFYEDRVRLEPDEAIALIHKAGGVAILAHPNNLKRTVEETEQYIMYLQSVGLDGIEARYNLHTPEETARYLALAERLGLLTSGGSDFHGPTVKEKVWLGHVEGDAPAPVELLAVLEAAKPTR